MRIIAQDCPFEGAASLRRSAALCRESLRESVTLLKKIERTAAQVITLFPDLALAVEEGEPDLARDFFATVKSWVREMYTEVNVVQAHNKANAVEVGDAMKTHAEMGMEGLRLREELQRQQQQQGGTAYTANGGRHGVDGSANTGAAQHQHDVRVRGGERIDLDPETLEVVRQIQELRNHLSRTSSSQGSAAPGANTTATATAAKGATVSATANDGSTAEATAGDNSAASATAAGGYTATATANGATVSATANDGSTAEATAGDNSPATDTAAGGYTATATANGATANDGSTAEATAGDNSPASATAAGGYTATATANGATANDGSTAEATAGDNSPASATAAGGYTATATAGGGVNTASAGDGASMAAAAATGKNAAAAAAAAGKSPNEILSDEKLINLFLLVAGRSPNWPHEGPGRSTGGTEESSSGGGGGGGGSGGNEASGGGSGAQGADVDGVAGITANTSIDGADAPSGQEAEMPPLPPRQWVGAGAGAGEQEGGEHGAWGGGMQLARMNEDTCYSEVQQALETLQEIDSVLEQLALFWANSEVIFDVLLRKGDLVEKFVTFANKPRLLQRFRERLADYKRFWEGVQSVCNKYVCGQHKCGGLQGTSTPKGTERARSDSTAADSGATAYDGSYSASSNRTDSNTSSAGTQSEAEPSKQGLGVGVGWANVDMGFAR
ncbi:unnamed protein product [Ectocarpus sp. CCAP 1310/34]|nr:unnamed protein product [Ectocarpus sp. CCAP 1310/34]